MQNFEQVSRELERRGKADQVKRLAQSADGAKLAGMIDSSELGKAAKAGDPEALKKLLGSVLNTPEGKRLAENIRRMMGE